MLRQDADDEARDWMKRDYLEEISALWGGVEVVPFLFAVQDKCDEVTARGRGGGERGRVPGAGGQSWYSPRQDVSPISTKTLFH